MQVFIINEINGLKCYVCQNCNPYINNRTEDLRECNLGPNAQCQVNLELNLSNRINTRK